MEGVSTVRSNLKKYQDKMNDKFYQGMDKSMAEANGRSQKSAPWTDRTGNARASIFAYANKEEKKILGRHGIGIFYGKFLELSNQGKYRIIWPTMDWVRSRILKNISN